MNFYSHVFQLIHTWSLSPHPSLLVDLALNGRVKSKLESISDPDSRTQSMTLYSPMITLFWYMTNLRPRYLTNRSYREGDNEPEWRCIWALFEAMGCSGKLCGPLIKWIELGLLWPRVQPDPDIFNTFGMQYFANGAGLSLLSCRWTGSGLNTGPNPNN